MSFPKDEKKELPRDVTPDLDTERADIEDAARREQSGNPTAKPARDDAESEEEPPNNHPCA